MGYSMARTGKDRTPAYIPISELREKCFAPFKECVEAGALQACGTDQSRVETLSNLTVNNTAPVTTRYDDRGSWLSCGEPSQFVGQPIAILSSQSAASMGIAQS